MDLPRERMPMPELVLQEIDPSLAERIQRVARARGWTVQEAALRLLEQGLMAVEQEVGSGLETDEADALAEAISALKDLPPGPGF